MTKLRCIVAFIGLFLFVINSANAQKKIERILDYYEAGAYYLTVKKINDLKTKHHSKPRIQLLLADSYWQIGNKKLSTEIYENLAVADKIPVDFQAKYERVMFEKSIYASLALNSIPTGYFEIPSAHPKTKGSIMQPVLKKRKSVPKFELTPQKTHIPSVTTEAKLTKMNSIVPNVIKPSNVSPVISLTDVKPIEIKRINEKRLPVTSLVNNRGGKSVGKYRIRIGVTTNEEASTLVKYLGSTEVKIFEWAKRKIAIVGFYDSPEMAQVFIDQYLKYFYDKAVVVRKVDGQYKSVNQIL